MNHPPAVSVNRQLSTMTMNLELKKAGQIEIHPGLIMTQLKLL
jgi:hypothetical protein